jgi:protease-4
MPRLLALFLLLFSWPLAVQGAAPNSNQPLTVFSPGQTPALPELPGAAFLNPASGVFEPGFRLDWVHGSPSKAIERESCTVPGDALLLDLAFPPDGPSFGGTLRFLDEAKASGGRNSVIARGLRGSLPLGKTAALGLSWEFLEGGALDGRNDGRLGFLWRPGSGLSFSAIWDHLNEASRGDTRLGRTWNLGLGLRPGGTPHLTLAGHWEFLEDGGATSALVGLLRLSPFPGFALAGGVEARKLDGVYEKLGVVRLELTPGVGGLALGGGFASNGDNGGFDVAVSLSGARRDSVFAPADEIVVADIPGAFALVPQQPLLGDEEISLLEFRSALYEVARDRKVRGVLFRLGGFGGTLPEAEELALSMKDLKAHGKKVYFYTESGDELALFLAAHADYRLLHPSTAVTAAGFASSSYYLRDTLAAIGVKAQFLKIGAYKNAPDQFTRRDSSPEEKEARTALLEESWNLLTGAWKKTKAGSDWLAKSPLTPDEAVELGLFQGLSGRFEVQKRLSSLEGRRYQYSKLLPAQARVRETWRRPKVVAVVPVQGMLMTGRSGGFPGLGFGTVGSDTLLEIFDRLEQDHDTGAVLLLVDSPGGDALAAELVHERLARLAARKPVAAVFSSVAASGGYYVAMPATRIFTPKTVITGSIGVFVGKFVISGLLDKLKIGREHLVKGERAGMYDLDRELSPAELEAIQGTVKANYELFVKRVAEGRGLSVKRVKELGEGRVWSGGAAVKNGLADETGGALEAALWLSRRAGGTDDPLPHLVWHDGGWFLGRLFGNPFHAEVLSQEGLSRILGLLQQFSTTRAWAVEPTALRLGTATR